MPFEFARGGVKDRPLTVGTHAIAARKVTYFVISEKALQQLRLLRFISSPIVTEADRADQVGATSLRGEAIKSRDWSR